MKTLRTRDGFSKTEASYLKNTSNIIFNKALSLINEFNLERPVKFYEILERKNGRFEISLIGKEKDDFYSLLLSNVNFKKQDLIIRQFFKRKWNVDPSIDVGLLPVLGESEEGNYHRDCHFYDSWNESKPFYFTVLVYLDDFSGTEFVLPTNNLSLPSKEGQIIVFDGSIEHRGLANSNQNRMAIYLTYTHPEYVDEDFHLPKIKDVLKLKKIGEKV